MRKNSIANRTIRRLAFLCASVCVVLCLFNHSAFAQRSPIAEAETLPHVRWQDADKVVNQIAVVSGKIIDVGSTPNNSINFLNFDRRRDVFKVVIFEAEAKKFAGPLKELYEARLVSIRGEVTLYKGVPQIRVRTPDQIRFIDRIPPNRVIERAAKRVGPQIRVGSFNVRNLFDGVDDPYHLDETTKAKPRIEIERLAKTIRKIDCDVLGMQEIENRGYLQRFNDAFLSDMGYEVVHYSGNDRRGSGLAILSRVPVGAVTSHRHRRFPADDGTMRRFSRDLLCVELEPTHGEPFEVWVTHLKSKRGGAAVTEPQRVAEASEIRRLVDKKLQDNAQARVIIVGDFNDTKDSKPLRRLVGEGPTQLKSYWDTLPEGTVTYTLDPYRSLIDHILCTPQAARGFVSRSHRVASMSLQTSGSDHNPIVADFEF